MSRIYLPRFCWRSFFLAILEVTEYFVLQNVLIKSLGVKVNVKRERNVHRNNTWCPFLVTLGITIFLIWSKEFVNEWRFQIKDWYWKWSLQLLKVTINGPNESEFFNFFSFNCCLVTINMPLKAHITYLNALLSLNLMIDSVSPPPATQHNYHHNSQLLIISAKQNKSNNNNGAVFR